MMNIDISGLKNSASMELMIKAKELKHRGIDLIDLAGGEPDFDTPIKIKQKAIEEIQKGNTHYSVGQGLLSLRKSIQFKLKHENGIDVTPDEIIVTPGAKMAIYLAVRSCISAGDEVMILMPSWVSYTEIVRSAGGIPVSVKLSDKDNYHLSMEDLTAKVSCRTKMLIVCSPNNPTGRILNEEEIRIIDKFSNQNDIIVLSDEIYEKIVFDKRKNISIASFPNLRERTITVNGFSKSYAMTGWRMAYLAGEISYIKVINKLFSHTITGTSPFLQEACIKAFECNNEVEIMRRKYEERRNIFIKSLNSIPGVKATYPEGSFYAWVRFNINNNMGSLETAQLLLNQANVVGVPGVAYGEMAENYIRFSFANDVLQLNEACARIAKCLYQFVDAGERQLWKRY